MAAIITEKFRVHNAKQFKEDFGESASSTYVFIGRSHSWPTDTSPPTPVNGTSEEVDAWADMTALKKVGSADVSHGLTRHDWTSGVKYDEYQHDISASNTSTATSATSLYASRFYVMTDEYHVYKCLRTGRDSSGSTVNSTVKPTGTSATALVETSDTGAASGRGYLWKYMYTVTASDTIKFVTNDFIPVKTIGALATVDGTSGALNATATNDGSAQWDVENGAVSGGCHHAVVTAEGSNYNNGTYNEVPVVGDGSGGKATVVIAGGKVTHVTFTGTNAAFGTGYTQAEIRIATTTTNLSGIGSGSGATVKVIISPQYGHGADPIQEMGGNHIIVNSRLEFGEGGGDFPTDNDFRRIGLVQDPFASATTVATAPTLAAYHQMTVSDASDLSVDDVIRSANADGAGVKNSRIVSITGNVVSHIPIADSAGGFSNFAAGNNVFLGNSNKGTVSSVNAAYPEVVKNSGQVMYIENRGAVTRAADQIEDIKLIIEM